jgi:preprotein translocase subunit SecE
MMTRYRINWPVFRETLGGLLFVGAMIGIIIVFFAVIQ